MILNKYVGDQLPIFKELILSLLLEKSPLLERVLEENDPLILSPLTPLETKNSRVLIEGFKYRVTPFVWIYLYARKLTLKEALALSWLRRKRHNTLNFWRCSVPRELNLPINVRLRITLNKHLIELEDDRLYYQRKLTWNSSPKGEMDMDLLTKVINGDIGDDFDFID